MTYTYDAWGNATIGGPAMSSLGVINPIRYKGYYYDTDTGFYYLQSRYYNPTWGRFINADDIDFLGADGNLTSYNLFAYCGNNPVNLFDPTGKFVLATLLIGIGVGALISSGINLANQVVAGNGINWRSVAASALAGGVVGGLMAIPGAQGVALGLSQTMAWGGMASSIGYGVYNLANGTSATFLGYAKAAVWGALFAGIMYTLPNVRVTNTKSILSNKTYTNSTGKVDNYVSPKQGYNAAKADFNALKPTNVRLYQTKSGTTTVGYIKGGKTVNLHTATSTKGPTLEIYDPSSGFSIKIRY